MKTSPVLERIVLIVREGKTFLITGHIDPDPDCLGSIGALYLGLVSLGKQVAVIPPGAVPESLLFIPGVAEGLKAGREGLPPGCSFDCAFVLDGDLDRTGEAQERVKDSHRAVNIDHHATNKGQGDINYVDPQAAAAGQLVYRLLKELGISISRPIATALFAAIAGDTGFFRYSNTTGETLATAAELVSFGADPAYISQEMNERKKPGFVRLVADVLDTLKISEDGRIAWIILTGQMLRRHGLTLQEAEDLVSYPRMIDGVEVAIMFKENEEANGIKVSFRSRRVIDVSEIAGSLGGGGHPRASGCSLNLPLEEAMATVLDAVKTQLDEAEEKGLLS